MTRLLDGPAAGTDLMLRRAPVWLRVVVAPDGTVDALDQLQDTPQPDEEVHVYRQVEGTSSVVFACRTRSRGGRYEGASYRHVPGAPADDLRDSAAWQAWCVAQPGVPADVAVPAGVA